MRVRNVSALLVLVACGGDGDVVPDAPVDEVPREVIQADKMLLVSELAEGTLHGGPNDRARIVLTASVANLDWNLHGHANNMTQTVHEELGVMTANYMFSPEATADWSLLVRNQDTSPMMLQVRVELYGEMTWSGWD